MTLPTGIEIVLQQGPARAVVGTVAAVLRSLSVGGVQLVETTPADATPQRSNGIVLSPWPNRVRDARWMLDGEPQQLDITEPERDNALHGLLRFTEYAVREQTPSSVTLGATIYPQHGWPFVVDTWVRYELTATGLTVTHGAENLSPAKAPYATGAHPYLRIGAFSVDDLVLTAPASTYIVVDDRLNPTGKAPVSGTTADLRAGVAVRELVLDTAYGDIDAVDGVIAWLDAPDGSRLALWQDPEWKYLQVYTAHDFPDPAGPRTAVAIEPMTAPPDAFNSGEALVWIEPGQSWTGSWGLRFSATR